MAFPAGKEPVRVTEWVDIQAPRPEVFDLVTDIERRMQLSPLWGTARLQEKTEDYPAEGSFYRMLLEHGLDEYESMVVACKPGMRFAYRLCIDRETSVTWVLQDVRMGTRITYTEEFLLKEGEGEEFVQAVREAVRKWLENIRRYAELRGSILNRLVKFGLDKFFLRLRPDQRRVVAMILFMQAVAAIAFLMAMISVGIARFLFN